MSHVQHNATGSGLDGALSATGVPMSMRAAISVRERRIGIGRRLAGPLGMAAYGLFYAVLFAAVVVLPVAVVIFGLVILFG